MKKICLILAASVLIISCAPVLTKDMMQRGTYGVRLADVRQNQEQNTGRLFILGGIVVKTTLTKEGSLVEAIYVPVNSQGYLRSYGTSNERFLALYRGKDILDPLIYSEKREVTVAGEFIGTRKGAIGEMDYVYPLFDIKEIYLWEEYKAQDYYRYSPYYPPYYRPPYYRYRYSPFYDDYPFYPYYYPW
ncbi:MAG: Slp family lipoprotein [Nitrospirae bacterium]|nr:Slp family lipoprotein [Nitrospirota bacterium]